MQQNNTLVEEMLHLIIMVIGRLPFLCQVIYDGSENYTPVHVSFTVCAGERYVSGIGQVEPFDEVRREIIHQLSIRPMAHSELVKALPENVRPLSASLF